MTPEWTIESIRAAFRVGRYRFTLHAEGEREADAILIDELESAFSSETLELLEEYPTDPRGRSGLFLGFGPADMPLHGVFGLADPDIVVVITVYRPNPELWRVWRRRL